MTTPKPIVTDVAIALRYDHSKKSLTTAARTHFAVRHFLKGRQSTSGRHKSALSIAPAIGKFKQKPASFLRVVSATHVVVNDPGEILGNVEPGYA